MHSSQPKVFLITGCSSGLGYALAERALAAGQQVLATARNVEPLSPLAEKYPERCRVFVLDVCDAGQVKAAVTRAQDGFGRIDVIVNNAGYGLIGAFEEFTEDETIRNFQVNFFGALNVLRESLPILRSQRTGHVINISAAAAISNYPGFSIYGATKAALESVSEALAAELKPLGIKVTIVQPGPFRTKFISRSLERAGQRIGDYDQSSGKFLRLLESMDGKQPGDPSAAADAILSAVNSEAPPLRLVLGKYAIDKVRRQAGVREREISKWEAVGAAADFSQ